MNFQIVTVVAMAVICGVLSVGGSPAATYIQSKADQSLMKYMTKARAANYDGSRSIECFNYYIPLLNEIAETYQKNYEACLSTASNAIAQLVAEGADSRNSIIASSNEVCSRFQSCQAEDDILSFFDCYSNSGDENVRQIYSISQDAQEEASNYRESYRTIQITSERCTNETQRVYVTDTANAYDELDLCLANGLNIPTTTQAPSTDGPSTVSSDAPSTEPASTIPPSTEVPSTIPPSSEAPSTEGPSTIPPSSEAPSTEDPGTIPPSSESPSTEAPSSVAPSSEAPSTEGPSSAAPSTEPPSSVAPSSEAPSTEGPSSAAPSSEAPSSLAPSSEAPSTEAPSSAAPSTEAPSSAAPSSEAPSSAAPSSEAPSSAAPSSEPTTSEAPETSTVEQDQVEELVNNSVRSRLEQLVQNWRKRLA